MDYVILLSADICFPSHHVHLLTVLPYLHCRPSIFSCSHCIVRTTALIFRSILQCYSPQITGHSQENTSSPQKDTLYQSGEAQDANRAQTSVRQTATVKKLQAKHQHPGNDLKRQEAMAKRFYHNHSSHTRRNIPSP